jgi:hypothetical protein
MATLSSLADRVRVELGDLGKSFVTSFVADGTTNRFKLHYAPLDGTGVNVFKNGVNVTSTASVEEQTGILVLDTVPAEGAEFIVSGNYYRYFTASEMQTLVTNAVTLHTSGHALDSMGRSFDISNLPLVDEYPVVVYATTLALYALATDASFDIDIAAPDGVSIPRSERYRQLMQMIETRQQQYRELCAHLGIGLFRIEVLPLQRISKTTGRLIPIYKAQEVDDRSYPQRVHLDDSSYGSRSPEWPTTAEELTAYQGRSFNTSLDYVGNYAGKSFTAKVLPQRSAVIQVTTFNLTVDTPGTDVITAASRTSGSTTITLTTSAVHGLVAGNPIVIINVDGTVDGYFNVVSAPTTTSFTITGTATTALALTGLTGQVETNVDKEYTFNISLTRQQTRLMAERTYWSISTVDPFTNETVEIKGGNFFTVRAGTVVI